jgi:fluoroacetyl-CoA thioesterase
MPPETTEALLARLALLGGAPSPDEPELKGAFTLFAERMRLLDEAADLGAADPPYLAPPIPAGLPAAAPPLAPAATGPRGGPPGLVEAAAMVRDGAVTSVALVERALAAVEAADGRLGAFVAVFGEDALAEAAELDAELAAGRLRGPLHGVPVAVKDLIDVAGAVTGAGSPKLADNRAAAGNEVPGMPEVLATGFLVGLLEWACIQAVNPHIDWPREQTVGTHVDVSHEAATPPGLEVLARVKLTNVDGRRLEFEVEVSDGVEIVSRGSHERFVVDAERFAQKAARKHDTA